MCKSIYLIFYIKEMITVAVQPVVDFFVFALFQIECRRHYFRGMDQLQSTPRPAVKSVDDLLFKYASTDIAKLNRQSRKELRMKARNLWKEKNALRTNPGPKFV